MTVFDLNCDLGEGEPPAATTALMACVSSANVACGGHAGDPDSMLACARLARENGCHLGAHPGLPGHFGRRDTPITPDELRRLLTDQVEILVEIARAAGATLHHIKLHGALYHATDAAPALADAYLTLVAQRWPRLKIYARAGGRVAGLAPGHGLETWPEAFLDRAYRPDGSLVPRNEPGATIHDPVALRCRIQELRERGILRAVDGTPLHLAPGTLCVHGDSPGAPLLAATAATELGLPVRRALSNASS